MTFIRPLVVATGLVLASAAIVAVPGCSISSYSSITATVERTQCVADARSLSVETRNGTIKVIRDDSATELSVKAKVRCAGSTQAEADQRAADSKLVVDRQADGAVRVAVDFAPRADASKGKYSNDGASFEVRAPGTLTGISLNSSNGSITADGFKGTLAVRTSNGGVKVNAHDGPVQVDTSNGAIEATALAGPAELETSNGAVDVSLSEGSTQNVNVRSSNGSILLTLPASWNGAMTARTSNGKVTVRADDGRATEVTASRSEGSATIGKGTATATLRSSNGSVQVVVKGAEGAPAKN